MEAELQKREEKLPNNRCLMPYWLMTGLCMLRTVYQHC